jgi:hypothetical protein
MESAFQALRSYARDHNAKLSVLAGQIAAGRVSPADVLNWGQ